MLSIPDALYLHRATRHRYMNAARRAQAKANFWNEKCIVRNKWGSWPLYEKVLRPWMFHAGALRCFVRHARAANRKLVQVKRLQRMLSSPNNWDGWI